MWSYVAYVVIGLIAGFASALLGIGGGIVLVPALIMVLAVPARAATATALAYIVPISLYGTLRQWQMGQDIRWALALLAVPLGVVGAELGSRAKQALSNAHLQMIFGVVMVLIGLRLGLEGWAAWKAQSRAPGTPPSAEAPAERAP